jgi:tight adherence protein B
VTEAVVAGMLALAVAALYVWYRRRAQRLAAERLADVMAAPDRREADRDTAPRASRSFPPRYPYVAPSLGLIVAAALWLFNVLPGQVAVAAGMLVGVLGYLAEEFVADQRAAKIETELAAAIDLLIGSLRSGASLLAAFESALQEAEPLLRPYFQEVAGRIRLGDDPREAVADLQLRVPLETFRLFATSVAIHWEVGGSLASTLSTVGRTLRDRIELGRRVRAQGVESHASVAVVLSIAYILAFLMWRTNPDRLEAFVATAIGTTLVAGAIVLQALGLVWMSRLSRSTY